VSTGGSVVIVDGLGRGEGFGDVEDLPGELEGLTTHCAEVEVTS
jgi:hypothetical protein